MSIIASILESLGIKRKLSALFLLLSQIILHIPALAPFAPFLNQIAGYLGIIGLGHASVEGTLSLTPLATIASFFAALDAVSQTVPVLLPYVPLVHGLAVLFSALASGSIIGRGK